MDSQNRRSPSAKTWFALVTYGILLYVGLEHFAYIKSVFAWVFAILQPVAYGICIAFIINLFLKFFREKVFCGMANSSRNWEQKLCPILAVFCTIMVALILLSVMIWVIVPQISTAVNTLLNKLPNNQDQFFSILDAQLTAWHIPDALIEKLHSLDMDWETAIRYISDFLDGKAGTVLGTAFNATATVLSTASNLVLGLIISIYLLAQKDRVLRLTHKLIELIVPDRYEESTFRILRLTNRSFANFLMGQFIESVIIGVLCAIGMAVLRFPYAATVGVMTGITALIPIIGAWIGGGVGALLIWTEAPEKVIWFLVFILVLQQLEGQFIYPRVVGSSIGLPGLLVLIAVITGGGFGGIIGIIVTVPLFAIGYSLLRDAIDRMPQRNPETPPAEDDPPESEDPAPEESPENAS